jgi:flagellar basal-body rod protein FlgB
MKQILTIAALLVLSVSANAQSLSKALQGKMDYLMQRQSVVSSNIANASTPGYLAQDLVYKPSSAKSKGSMRMAATNSKHMAPAGFNSRFESTVDTTFIRNDGNSVRIDDQMLKMAQIQQEHTMATRLFSKHLAMQKLLVKSQ